MLRFMFETSQEARSLTVQERLLMGLVKKRLPRERQGTNCSSNIEIINILFCEWWSSVHMNSPHINNKLTKLIITTWVNICIGKRQVSKHVRKDSTIVIAEHNNIKQENIQKDNIIFCLKNIILFDHLVIISQGYSIFSWDPQFLESFVQEIRVQNHREVAVFKYSYTIKTLSGFRKRFLHQSCIICVLNDIILESWFRQGEKT